LSFKRGDYRPFVRASISALDQLQAASNVEIAASIPFIDIRQVNQFTGEIIGENIMKELLSPADISDGVKQTFQERPLVAMTSLEVKTEQQYGYAYNTIVNMEFTVYRPDVVFSTDEYSAWRELLVEGNCFILSYGWARNSAISNDLLNGIGFYDKDTGLLVQSKTSLLIAIVKYSVSMDQAGNVRFTMEARTMGNIGLRQVSLMQELVEEFLSEKRDSTALINAISDSPISTIKNVLTSITDDLDVKVIEAIQLRVKSLDERLGFVKDRRRFLKLGDIFDSLIAPIVERMCLRIGYKRADLFLGNFNKRAGKTSSDLGSIELSSKSIAEFPVPVKLLRDTLSNIHLKGKLMRVESLVEALLSLTRGQARWSSSTRFVPALFPIAHDVIEGDGNVFRYAIADSYDGSDVFDDPDTAIPSESITKSEVFEKLIGRGVPIIEPGRINSIVKTLSFEIEPEPLQRSIFAERQLKTRKDRIQLVEQPDPNGLAGRANSKTVIPLGTLQGSMSMVGNFIFNMFSYVWVEFFGAYPISGIYNIRDRTDRIESGVFTTTIGVISEGIDPFNTRRRLSAVELSNERKVADERRRLAKKR
jgi:hypothetical protein